MLIFRYQVFQSHLWCDVVCRAHDVVEDLARPVEDRQPEIAALQPALRRSALQQEVLRLQIPVNLIILP